VSLVGVALAVALLVYFVWKSLSMRIFLLGLPFLMYMGESVFFDKVKIFWMPQRLGSSTMIMVWLVVVWVICMDLVLPHDEHRRVRRLFGPPLRLPEELVLGVLAAAILLDIAISCIRFGDALTVLGQASGWLYLLLGYLLVRGIVAMAPTEDVIKFLSALVVINAGAALLYIANQALGIPFYAGSVSGTEVFHGQTIVRGFAFYPQLLLLTLAVLFAKPRWTWLDPVILIVNVVAIWLSYTRSWLLVALVVLGVVLFVRLIKARQTRLALRRLGGIVLLVVVVGAAMLMLLPTQSSYFISRLSATQGAGGLASESSFAARRSFIAATYRHASDTDSLLGVGFASPAQDAELGAVERWSADTLWVPVVYRLGLVGVALFVAVFFAYLGRAALTALRCTGDCEYLGLVWLGVIAGTMMGTFVSWSVVNPNRFPLGLWPFAFLAALPLMPRQECDDTEEGE
jgi:hypothetical protein